MVKKIPTSVLFIDENNDGGRKTEAVDLSGLGDELFSSIWLSFSTFWVEKP